MNKVLSLVIVTIVFLSFNSIAQNMMTIVPANTATHTAVQSGDWSNPATWDVGTVPSDAAIVIIPSGFIVDYTGGSNAHIFAIRVDGEFNCFESNSANTTSLRFDTFFGLMNSMVKFHAFNTTDGKIDVTIEAFDIEAHKNGTSGFAQVWNANAISHYSDGATTYHVEYDVGPDNRFNSYADALAGNTSVTELSRVQINDGSGVLGRYDWDSTQLSLGLVTMGELEIIGQEKLNMSKLASDALQGQNTIVLDDVPTGWKIGDEVVVTRGGNQGTLSNGEDDRTIASIAGNTITFTANLNKNHEGRPADNLHCYAGNLTRNITFSSPITTEVTQRGHIMAMHNDMNVQIKNVACYDLGRTDKSKLLNDFVWSNWKEPVVFKSKISTLGQECVEMNLMPKEDISNSRGRYSLHLHKLGAISGATMAEVTGNVVWGNPGWGISHHDSHANVSDNVVYDVVGAGIISETGSETGIWNHNLVVDISAGHNTSPYDATRWFDDYLFSGQGLGMKGRAVVCDSNVIVNAVQGIGVMNMSPSVANMDRMDATALATTRPDHMVNHWPLSTNGYSSEGDGVLPVEPALIIKHTDIIWCNQGLKSIERDMGVNHESRSLFDGINCWGVNQGLRITYQADYTFKDVFISGKTMNTQGMYLWKHSHNHVFDGVKLADLGHAMTVSKLVESGNGDLKTRNNGFTPWYFIDLELDNVGAMYQILKEDPNTATTYDEHGDNPIHLTDGDFVTRPTTFTILDSSEMVIDYASGDLMFEVDGIITDELGSYDMGIKQAWSQGTLRLDYPERIYEFASTAKLDEYVANNAVYEDPATNEKYIIVEEFVPDRRTNDYTGFPMRIKILNAPTTGDYATPSMEPSSNFNPQLHISSRLGSASQSSTQSGIMVESIPVDASATKAIDGNNNGRINVQQFQQLLVPVGSFSETETELEPWFDLDLGKEQIIDFIDLWSYVGINGEQMETLDTEFTDFYVMISDTAFGSLSLADAQTLADYSFYKDATLNRKFSMNNLGAKGRYVRVQGVGTRKIRLAEVEVIGTDCFATFGTDVQEACTDFTWIDGVTYSNSNNTAVYTVPNQMGCDSIVTLDLTINQVPMNATTVSGTTISAVENGADYQWLDCEDNMNSIIGETNQTFMPSIDGNYAVEVTLNGCSDTSECVLIDYLGLVELEGHQIYIHPNPVTASLTIVGLEHLQDVNGIEVFSPTGEVVMKLAASSQIDVSELTIGVYFLSIQSNHGVETIRFVKQ